jgi:hypothetical protein
MIDPHTVYGVYLAKDVQHAGQVFIGTASGPVYFKVVERIDEGFRLSFNAADLTAASPSAMLHSSPSKRRSS